MAIIATVLLSGILTSLMPDRPFFLESLDEVNRQEAILQKHKAALDWIRQTLVDVEARISRLEPKIEGKHRRMHAKDATVADVGLAPTGAK